jgi:hypothetical protein
MTTILNKIECEWNASQVKATSSSGEENKEENIIIIVREEAY